MEIFSPTRHHQMRPLHRKGQQHPHDPSKYIKKCDKEINLYNNSNLHDKQMSNVMKLEFTYKIKQDPCSNQEEDNFKDLYFSMKIA